MLSIGGYKAGHSLSERIGKIGTVLILIFGCGSLQAQDNTLYDQQEQVIVMQPEDMEWQDGPASFEEGSQFVLLEGDLDQEDFFNLRLKLPDGFQIAPHWHPNVERVTVISGTFHLGHGDQVDLRDMEALGAGSYFSLPPEMTHFAVTEGETIIQLTTIGPWKIHYVNSEDDPRLR